MVGGSGPATDTLVPKGIKGGLVGLPGVAAGTPRPVAARDRRPQGLGSGLGTIPDEEGDDLAGAPTHRQPEPAFLGLGLDEAPDLVEFEHVAVLPGQERGSQRGQGRGFFIQAAMV